mmetsp:Transcript_134017/g.231793  ORF Transcript_134017/g.231793 Transcript_134017/m.231793 type:complete len:127 (-) Transcript_134017:130-510(-)
MMVYLREAWWASLKSKAAALDRRVYRSWTSSLPSPMGEIPTGETGRADPAKQSARTITMTRRSSLIRNSKPLRSNSWKRQPPGMRRPPTARACIRRRDISDASFTAEWMRYHRKGLFVGRFVMRPL